MAVILEFMNALKKLIIVSSFCIVAGCSTTLHDAKSDSGEKLDARMSKIDLAIAEWCWHQALAADEIGKFPSVKFGPITTDRDPQMILHEQGINIRTVEKLDSSQSAKLNESIKFWESEQLKAAESLRVVLKSTEYAALNEHDHLSILQAQKHDINILKLKMKTLGCEYW